MVGGRGVGLNATPSKERLGDGPLWRSTPNLDIRSNNITRRRPKVVLSLKLQPSLRFAPQTVQLLLRRLAVSISRFIINFD